MNRIFLILWGDPKFYQTIIFLAQILSRKGYEVFILSKNTKKQKDIIKQANFGKKTKIFESPNFFLGYSNFFDYFVFLIFILIKTFSIKPRCIIFFNKKALFSSILLNFFKKKNVSFIYHNFDFEILKNTQTFFEKLYIKLEFLCSNICDFLIFPSFERSKIFVKNAKNKFSKTFYLMNCFPVKRIKISSQDFKKFIKKNNLKNKKVVCHLGSIGKDHYLEEIVKGFKYVNKNTVLVIGGNSLNGYSNILKNIIRKSNLQKKVFIFEDISNELWFEILKYSDLGLCFYKPSVLSHKFMAGTSQKFNNYLFFKIPMLVNDNSDFKNFKKKFDIFNMINPRNPRNIGLSINKIFTNKKRYYKIQKNMKKSFNEKLNFEYQYSISYKKVFKIMNI